MKTCKVPDCDSVHHAHGYCQLHYQRMRKHGSTETPFYALSPKERLLKKRKISESGCWEWAGFRNPNGYGQVGINNKVVLVPRAAYQIWVGSIPEGMSVLHSCDNPACFNPDHLRAGTDADNSQDCLDRNRQANGSKLPQSKLVENDVLKIRELLARGLTQKHVAKMFGVTASNICNIHRGKTWKHI